MFFRTCRETERKRKDIILKLEEMYLVKAEAVQINFL